MGVARTDVEVRVVGDDGATLPIGEIGEIVVRGDVVMSGYWEQPDATADTIRDGWLHTGDVGSFDADGYLTLRDRSKDLIISGGMNICPREVEETLLRHAGLVAVSVVGRPDPEWGEAVVAFVVATDPGTAPTVEELDQLCLDHIARYKRPRTTGSSTACRPTTMARSSSGSCAIDSTANVSRRIRPFRRESGVGDLDVGAPLLWKLTTCRLRAPVATEC